MPVYNGEPYLGEAIESVLAQTCGDFELIIADNASTDATADICEGYSQLDSRIRYVRNETNIGAARNYNLTFELAESEYFRWHNADDLIEPHLHEVCLAELESHPELVLAAGTTTLIDDDGRVLENYRDNLHLMDDHLVQRLQRYFKQVGLTNVIYGLMRSSAMERTPLFGKGNIPAADIRFMAILCLHGKFKVMEEPLFYRRMHDQSSSADRSDHTKQATFWSGEKNSFSRATWKIHASYWHAVLNLDIPWDQKWPLYHFLIVQMYKRKKKLMYELVSI